MKKAIVKILLEKSPGNFTEINHIGIDLNEGFPPPPRQLVEGKGWKPYLECKCGNKLPLKIDYDNKKIDILEKCQCTK